MIKVRWTDRESVVLVVDQECLCLSLDDALDLAAGIQAAAEEIRYDPGQQGSVEVQRVEDD